MQEKDNKSSSYEENRAAFERKKRLLICLMCINLVLVIISAVAVIVASVSDGGYSSAIDEEDSTDKPSRPVSVTYSTDNFKYKTALSAEVKAALNTKDSSYLLIVNKSNPLGESFEPSSISELPSSIVTKATSVEKNTAIAAEALIAELRANGFNDIYITSGYRSFERQSVLFNYYTNEEMKKDSSLSRAEAELLAEAYSARPGYSEHQSGLCIDLIGNSMTDLINYGSETATEGDVGFAELEVYSWLLENAHKFGFILRYPENKTSVTGYDYESWHYRFVGVDAAAKMYKKGYTLEEYIKSLN